MIATVVERVRPISASAARWQHLALLVLLPLCACHWVRSRPVSEEVAGCRELAQQAQIAMGQEDWQRAEKLLREAIEICPTEGDALRHLSEALWQQGKRDEAVAALRNAIEITPDAPHLRLRLAELHFEAEAYPSAARELTVALDLNPDLPQAWKLRARIMRQIGHLEDAAAHYHRALRYKTDQQEILFELAGVQRQLGQTQRALSTLEALAEHYSPGSEPQDLMYLLGVLYLDLDLYEQAATHLELALSRGPESPEMLVQLARAELGAGRTRQADAAVRRALALDPRHPGVRRIADEIALAMRTGRRAR